MAKKPKVDEVEPIIHESVVCSKCKSTHVVRDGDKWLCRDCGKKF